jgi:hypothetical protein
MRSYGGPLGTNYHPASHVVAVRAGSRREVLIEDCIDEELAPLVGGLWARGILTIDSCQDAGDGLGEVSQQKPYLEARRKSREGWAYIGFPSAGHLLAFMSVVTDAAHHDSDAFADLIDRATHWVAQDAWWHEALVIFTPERFKEGTLFTDAGVRVNLPRSDVPIVTRLLLQQG